MNLLVGIYAMCKMKVTNHILIKLIFFLIWYISRVPLYSLSFKLQRASYGFRGRLVILF